MYTFLTPSLSEYLVHRQAVSKYQAAEVENYEEHNLLLDTFLSISPCLSYILDYRTGQYIYLKSNVKCISDQFLKKMRAGGTKLFSSQCSKADMEVINNKVFKNNLILYKSLRKAENEKLRFNYNFRICINEEVYNVQQQSTFLKSDEDGLPLLSIGMCHFSLATDDFRIVHTIEKYTEAEGWKNVHSETYLPELDESNILSKREKEIVKWIIEGLNTQDIADKLNISHHTVTTHRKNILGKINAKNVYALFKYAVQAGIV